MDVQQNETSLPRVAITFCTQCRWMLRAAYFAQELLSTFGTTIGEVALIPATGGIFTIHLTYSAETGAGSDGSVTSEQQKVCVWDRKADGGFPETKILKQKIRNYIDPDKSLGHSDTPAKSKQDSSAATDSAVCIDCPPSTTS